MRKALIPAFLLLLGSMVLGATVLREPLAKAASPFTNVIIGNGASNPLPVREQNVDASGNVRVHEQGTATVSISGTPSVTSGDQTQVIAAGITVVGVSTSTDLVGPPTVDVSHYKEVALYATTDRSSSVFDAETQAPLSGGGSVFVDLGDFEGSVG